MTIDTKNKSTTHRMSAKERKVQILQTAKDFIFNNGTGCFTLKKISQIIGITEAGVYRHFKTKEHVMLALLKSMFSPWQKSLKKLESAEIPPQYKILILCKIHLHFLINVQVNPILFISDAKDPTQKNLKMILQKNLQYVSKSIANILRQGIEQQIYKIAFKPEIIKQVILGTLQSAVIKWTLTSYSPNMANNTFEALSIILSSLGADTSQTSKYIKNYQDYIVTDEK